MIVDWERPFWYKDEFFASHGEVLGENIFRFVRRSLRRKHLPPCTAKFPAKNLSLRTAKFWAKTSFASAKFKAKTSFASHGEVSGENIFRLARRSFGAKNVSPHTANFRAKTSFASHGELLGENIFRFVRRSFGRKHLSLRTARFWAKNVSPHTANFRAKTSFASQGELTGEI